jgi:hypothetical protein
LLKATAALDARHVAPVAFPSRAKARVCIAEEVAMAQKLHIAFWSYDRTRLLADGSVKIEGADVAFHSARIGLAAGRDIRAALDAKRPTSLASTIAASRLRAN